MVALGLILLVLSGVFVSGVVLSNTDNTSAEAFGVTLSNVTLGGLFLAGAVAGLVFMLGLAMLMAGASRARRRKVETKRTVTGVRTEKEQLAEENSELKAQLAETSSRDHSPAAYPPASSSDDYAPDSAEPHPKHARAGLFGRH